MRPKRSAFIVAERQGRREVGPIAIDRLPDCVDVAYQLFFFGHFSRYSKPGLSPGLLAEAMSAFGGRADIALTRPHHR